jgi:hypothetical protein
MSKGPTILLQVVSGFSSASPGEGQNRTLKWTEQPPFKFLLSHIRGHLPSPLTYNMYIRTASRNKLKIIYRYASFNDHEGLK